MSSTEKEKLEGFRSRFGIAVDPQATARFRTRIVHAVRGMLVDLPYRERYLLEEEFGFRNGSHFVPGLSPLGDPGVIQGILEEMEAAETFAQIVECIQQLLWSLESRGYLRDRGRANAGSRFVARLEQAIQISPGMDLRVQRVGQSLELAPAGVPVLDAAVDHALQWLGRFPDVQKEYRQALTILAERQVEQYRQAQDSLRFGLEKLLKLLLQNSSRIEDQGKPLKDWLTARGVQENLRNAVVQILGILTKHYQNATVKHDNSVDDGALKAWADHEVEFMVYQYATLVRFLIEADA